MSERLNRLHEALLARYRFEGPIGQGGMAEVFLAQDIRHLRPVAIKVLRPEVAAAIARARFLREIRITANLSHPHILPLLDSGEAGGCLYYVAPYIDAGSLRLRLAREKQLSIPDALLTAYEIADALDSAHRHNVVHRDIKPENILLEEGHAVVADFGIARAILAAGEAKLTESGLVLGTPTYSSPEQAQGDRDIDGRSDIYSLGCVLFEMLAGEPPFTGASAQSVARKHLNAKPPPITRRHPGVPLAVAQMISRALAKSPSDRFASAGQFARALHTALRDGYP